MPLFFLICFLNYQIPWRKSFQFSHQNNQSWFVCCFRFHYFSLYHERAERTLAWVLVLSSSKSTAECEFLSCSLQVQGYCSVHLCIFTSLCLKLCSVWERLVLTVALGVQQQEEGKTSNFRAEVRAWLCCHGPIIPSVSVKDYKSSHPLFILFLT